MFQPDPLVFDAAAVARLRELDPQGASGLLERLYRTFLAALRKQVPQLLEAHARSDWAAVRFAAHTLRSSSASVGALRLSQQCGDIEARVRAGEPGPFDSQVADIRRETERLEASLRAQLEPVS